MAVNTTKRSLCRPLFLAAVSSAVLRLSLLHPFIFFWRRTCRESTSSACIMHTPGFLSHRPLYSCLDLTGVIIVIGYSTVPTFVLNAVLPVLSQTVSLLTDARRSAYPPPRWTSVCPAHWPPAPRSCLACQYMLFVAHGKQFHCLNQVSVVSPFAPRNVTTMVSQERVNDSGQVKTCVGWGSSLCTIVLE